MNEIGELHTRSGKPPRHTAEALAHARHVVSVCDDEKDWMVSIGYPTRSGKTALDLTLAKFGRDVDAARKYAAALESALAAVFDRILAVHHRQLASTWDDDE